MYDSLQAIISVEDNKWIDTIQGIYPRAAVILVQIDSGKTVNYMDSTISLHPTQAKEHALYKRWYSKSYDKRTSPKYKQFNIIKFPHRHSLMDPDLGHNIIMSQGHRLFKLNTLRTDFTKEMSLCVIDLKNKGFDLKTLINRIERFIFKHQGITFYGCNNIKLFKGILNQLNTKLKETLETHH